MDAHRLFFALTPQAEVRERILALAGSLPEAGGRRTRPDQIHLTLAFLGDVDPVAACAAGARAAAPAFAFALDELDSFHRSTWILRAPQAPFLPLLAALRRELHAGRLRAHDEHRAFVPHVTLRRRAHTPLARVPTTPIAWAAHELRLYDSHLDTGSYELLGAWPLC